MHDTVCVEASHHCAYRPPDDTSECRACKISVQDMEAKLSRYTNPTAHVAEEMEHVCHELAFRHGEAQRLLSVCEVLLEEHEGLLEAYLANVSSAIAEGRALDKGGAAQVCGDGGMGVCKKRKKTKGKGKKGKKSKGGGAEL